MNIEVIEAKHEDYSIVENLVRYYIYELSDIMAWDCPENGLFGGCDELPEYWQTQNPLTDSNEVPVHWIPFGEFPDAPLVPKI